MLVSRIVALKSSSSRLMPQSLVAIHQRVDSIPNTELTKEIGQVFAMRVCPILHIELHFLQLCLIQLGANLEFPLYNQALHLIICI